MNVNQLIIFDAIQTTILAGIDARKPVSKEEAKLCSSLQVDGNLPVLE